MENAVEKFAGKAEIYQKYRPDYAAACLDFLVRDLGWTAGKTIADVGAGTGIFTRQLLERGLRVQAVEPGADMLSVLRAADWPGHPPEIREGSAACTGLPDGSVDGVAAAQAFHWFDAAAFRAECRRICAPADMRPLSGTPGRRSTPDQRGRRHLRRPLSRLHRFFGGRGLPGGKHRPVFRRRLSKENLRPPHPHEPGGLHRPVPVGLLRTGPADAAYRPFIRALEGLFSAYAQAAPGRDQAEILFPTAPAVMRAIRPGRKDRGK